MAENKCDELFGKNGELVEFRKKQVLEGAFGIIQRHYEGKPNKMEMVAAMLGKKLGEEFTVKYQISKFKWCIEYHLAFTDKGLTHYGKSKDVILRQLMTGQAVIISD